MSDNILKNQDEAVEKLLAMNYLTGDNAKFSETEGGFLKLTVGDTEYMYVNIIRTFPFTDENRFLSVRTSDQKAEEIGIIEELSVFESATVELIERHLKQRYFMPKILKINGIKEEYGFAYWDVLTDKGRCKFASSAGSAGVVIHHKKGVIVKDSNENRYEIEDLGKLSPKELKRIDLYL